MPAPHTRQLLVVSTARSPSGVDPKKPVIELPSLNQISQLVKSRKRSELEALLRHANALKQLIQLSGTHQRISTASKAGQLGMDFRERYAVATIIAAVGAKRQLAAWKDIGDDLGDLSDLIIGLIIANVEDLVMDDISWRLEATGDRIADIEEMY